MNDPKEKSAYFFEGMSDMSSSHTKPTSRMYEVILIVVPLEKFNILGGRSSITSAKRWMGGVRKRQFLLIYSTIYADVGEWA